MSCGAGPYFDGKKLKLVNRFRMLCIYDIECVEASRFA